MNASMKTRSLAVLALAAALAPGLAAQRTDNPMAQALGKLLGPFPAAIVSVDPSGPAAKAGLAAGDVVTGLGGKDLSAPLPDALKSYKPGSAVKLTVIRGLRDAISQGLMPEPIAVDVTLGDKDGGAWLGVSIRDSRGFGRRNGARPPNAAGPDPSGSPGQLQPPPMGGRRGGGQRDGNGAPPATSA